MPSSARCSYLSAPCQRFGRSVSACTTALPLCWFVRLSAPKIIILHEKHLNEASSRCEMECCRRGRGRITGLGIAGNRESMCLSWNQLQHLACSSASYICLLWFSLLWSFCGQAAEEQECRDTDSDFCIALQLLLILLKSSDSLSGKPAAKWMI